MTDGVLSCFVLLLFLIASSACTKILPVLIIKNQFDLNALSAVLISKLIGNFLASATFGKLVDRIGIFRSFVISVIFFSQSVLLLLISGSMIPIYCLAAFLFGIFEIYALFIIKPAVSSITTNFGKQLRILFSQIAGFIAVLLLKLNTDTFAHFVICIALSSSVLYILITSKPNFKKYYIDIDTPSLFFTYRFYKIYLVFAFSLYLSLVSVSSYLLITMQKITGQININFLISFFLGQFALSFILEKYLNTLVLYKKIMLINFSIISITILAIFIFQQNINFTVMYIIIAVLGGMISISTTNIFHYLKQKHHAISVDITDEQVKILASFFAILINTSILQKYELGLFYLIIVNQFLSSGYILYNYFFIEKENQLKKIN